MRVLRYRLRTGSGGAGRFRGGEGIERDLLLLEDVTVSLITERRVSQPWGLQGGEPGATGENWVLPGGYERLAKRLPDKVTIRLKAGDVLRMLTPGGGGWGPASERPQAQLELSTSVGGRGATDARTRPIARIQPRKHRHHRAPRRAVGAPSARAFSAAPSPLIPSWNRLSVARSREEAAGRLVLLDGAAEPAVGDGGGRSGCRR
jgi:hypothetical protein